MDSLLRKPRGDTRPTKYWTVTWSHDSERDDGTVKFFVGPDPFTERQARAFARTLHIDPKRGYLRVQEVRT